MLLSIYLIIKSMAETTRARTGLCTNRYMDELVYGRIVSKVNEHLLYWHVENTCMATFLLTCRKHLHGHLFYWHVENTCMTTSFTDM